MTEREAWAMFAAAALRSGKTSTEACLNAVRVLADMQEQFPEPPAAPAPAGVTLPPEWEVNTLRRRDGVEIAKIGHNDWRVYADGQNHYLAKCESLVAALEAVSKISVRK